MKASAHRRADRREVADEREPRPQADHEPDRMLGHFSTHAVERPAAGIALHACAALALDAPLDPHEDLAVHRLRAGVAAPQAPADGGDEEKAERRQHQEPGEVDEVLRVEHELEDVEAPGRELEQHRLPPVQRDPWQAVEDQLRQPHHRPAPVREPAVHRTRVDRLLLLVERHPLARIGDRHDRNDGTRWRARRCRHAQLTGRSPPGSRGPTRSR